MVRQKHRAMETCTDKGVKPIQSISVSTLDTLVITFVRYDWLLVMKHSKLKRN